MGNAKMAANKITLRFSYNPLSLILGTQRKQGLRIGYMESTLKGFYLNCLTTGVCPKKLTQLLYDKYHCSDAKSSCELFLFLMNEGDRSSFSIMLPYLLATDNLNEFEEVIRKRFFGVERFIQQGRNLYMFIKYVAERKEPIIWMNDLERGIIAWDLGQLVGLARATQDCGFITKEQAWEYIEEANKICADTFRTSEEIDKSYLIGGAMKSNKIEDWEQMIQCYSLLREKE